MALNLVLYGIYLLTLFICISMGAFKWKSMHGPLRMFYILILTVVAGELTALIAEFGTGHNDIVYNVTDIIHAVLLCFYFGLSARKPLAGICLCIATLAFGIYNYNWLQPADLVNNYFLLWSGLVAICLGMYMIISLYQKNSSPELTRFAAFWISVVVLFYWMVNLLSFQVFNSFMASETDYAIALNSVHQISNVICYAVIATIFYKTPILIQ